MIPAVLVVVCGTILMLLPVIGRRDRAAWAKRVFVLTGALALVSAAVSVALRTGWLEESDGAAKFIRYCRTLINGAVIGLILALAFSGELQGRKKAIHPG